MKTKSFRDPIYHHNFNIYVYSTEKDCRNIKRSLDMDCDMDEHAFTVTRANHTYVVFNSTWLISPNSILQYVAHEAFHASTTAMAFHGSKLSKKTQEAFEYYHGYIFTNILKAITE